VVIGTGGMAGCARRFPPNAWGAWRRGVSRRAAAAGILILRFLTRGEMICRRAHGVSSNQSQSHPNAEPLSMRQKSRQANERCGAPGVVCFVRERSWGNGFGIGFRHEG
jgi:hypothetical protein